MDIKKMILEEVGKCIYIMPQQLAKVLGISVKKLREPLKELVDEHEIAVTKRGKLAVANTLGLYKGELEGKHGGYAFLRNDGELGDLFISQADRYGALDGELVLVKMKKRQNRGARPEGKVIEIFSTLDKTVVGKVLGNKKTMFVNCNDASIGDIFIPKGAQNGAKKDQMVVVELTKRSMNGRCFEGRIVEQLGVVGQPGMDVLVYARRFGLKAEFPQECIAEAAEMQGKKLSPKGRLDLRKVPILTIDGEDAKDLDDAVSLRKLENGNLELGVHIADVSHYVRQGSELDAEAIKRGTSVYLVDRVVPMLPAALSNDLCSLNPYEDKYTLSCMMEINRMGRVVSHSIEQSIICSSYRMTYNDVNAILGGDRTLSRKYTDIKPLLTQMNSLAKKLRRRRFDRGSIDFDINEAEIKLDSRGVPYDVVVRDRGDAEKLIEEFMLMANITVAQHYYNLEMPFLYRIHEQPDTEKMQGLAVFLGNFDIKLHGVSDIQPKDIQQVLSEVEGTPLSNVVNGVTLRSLKKARYDIMPVAHFGLAADQYCHFTSPIRRYPDLMAHRIIKMCIEGKNSTKAIARLEKTLPDIAKHTSARERNAIMAERTIDDVKMAEYMSTRIGQEFDGVISGVTKYGIFVELENMVEGRVPLSRMEDDYYVFYEKLYCAIGERTGNKIMLGDKTRITVIASDINSGKIEFAFAK